MNKSLIAAALAMLAAAPVAVPGAYAQDGLPSQIKIIVPFPAGGPTDVFGRHIAQALGDHLKTTIVVENRPGANGTIGADAVARSSPDGGTLLFNATHQAIMPALMKNIPYDTRKAFTPVALAATAPNAIVVNPKFPAQNLQDLIAMAKKDPGKIQFGTFGGANQLAGELFKVMAAVDLVNIPYKGAAPAMNDVIAGHIPMMFDTVTTVKPQVEAGTVRALAVTSLKRSAAMPEVPTVEQAANLQGYEALAWFGLFMPATGDTAVKAALIEAMKVVLNSKEVKEKIIAFGAEPSTLTGDDFQRFFDAELNKWDGVARRAQIEKQ
jgi:tripartite-type tricarboxylate transporter receptor subunit TctC